MSRDILHDRERALEYEFFRKVDQRLLEQLREKLQSDERKQALAKCTGVTDEAVLQELVDLGLRSENVLALLLVPLIRVAWADSHIDGPERTAVLEAAESLGHVQGTLGYQLLESWLERPPDEKVFTVWKDYVAALLKTMNSTARESLSSHLIDCARKVAKAAGGVLGAHKVSKVERFVLRDLENTLAVQ